MFRPKNTHSLALRSRTLRSVAGIGTAHCVIAAASLWACSSSTTPPVATGGAPGSGGASGTGGAASGGAASGGASSGGAVSTGGTSGGSSSGGGSSGGASSGGASSGGGSSGGSSSGGSGGGASSEFELAVTGVDASDNVDCDDGAEATCPLYPEDNTSFGANVSPAMSWPAGPEGTLSYAITLYDLSGGNAHWALYDIPAGTLALPAELPSGASLTTPIMAKQAGFNAGSPSYFGSGACENVYEFILYALDTATFDVGGASTAAGVITALEAATPLDTSFVRMQSREYCP